MLRPSNVVYLYRTRLRARWVQELLAIAGIAVGVALIFAALVANTSLTSSMQELTRGIVGDANFQVSARGPSGFGERILSQVQHIDGVASAAPILESRVNLVGPQGSRSVLLIGGDPRFARLGGPLVRPFAARGDDQVNRLRKRHVVAVPTPLGDELGLSLGAPVTVVSGSGTVDVPLAVDLQRRDIGAVVNSPITLAPLAYAQRITGMDGRLTRVFVDPHPGEERRVEAALRQLADDALSVREADADVAVFEQAAYPTKQSTALFSGLSALVGFLFAFSAVLLTVPQRRALIGDLHRAGHSLGPVLQVLLFDALVLGVGGSLVGLVLGDQVARHLFDEVPDYLSFTFSVGLDRAISLQSVLISVGAGILAACIAVLVPVRDAIVSNHQRRRRRHPPARAPAVAAVGGLAGLAIATLVAAAAPGAAMVGLVALTFALLLLLPLLLKGVTAASTALTRTWRSPAPTFAAIELSAPDSRARTLAVAATGALALFATVAIAGARADLQRGLDASTRDTVGNADLWITFPDAPNVLATTPFRAPREFVRAIERVDGVAAVRAYRGSLLDIGDRRAWVLAPPADAPRIVPPSQIKDGDVALAEQRLRRGGWVVLSEGVAETLGVAVGDAIELPSPVPTRVHVAAISTNLGWSPGAIVLNADDYADAWGVEDPSALHVRLEPGAPPAGVASAIERVRPRSVPLTVETRSERVALHYAASRDGLSRLTDIAMLVLAAAVLAMAIAMGAMIWQRRPVMAALKVHGYPESRLWHALLLESTILLGTGCVAGAAFGLYGQVLLSRALETITGFPVAYSAAVVIAAAILSLVTALALAMLALPGWLAVRVRPAPGTEM